MKKILRLLWTIVQIIGAVLLTIFVSIIILQFASQQPRFGLSFKAFVVQSGSMEPTIVTGDLVFVRNSRSYGKNDVITYRSPEGHTITHRIIETKKTVDGQIQFQTRGDNNHAADPYTISGSAILGRWWFTIPKLGYIQVYGRSPLGIIVIVSVILGWIASDFTWQKLFKKQQGRD